MISIRKLESLYGKTFELSGRQAKFKCPKCGVKSFWVHQTKMVYYCFSCETSGVVDDIYFPHKKIDQIVLPKGNLFPKGFMWVNDRQQSPDHWEYIKSRGINPDFIGSWGVYGDYCVFPIWKKKRVVYWQGRNIFPVKKRKTTNPEKSECALGKTDVVFNIEDQHGIIPRTHLIVVEGVFDALTVNGAAKFGSLIDEKQVRTIKYIYPELKKLTMVHDSDVPRIVVMKNQEVLRTHLKFCKIRHVVLKDGDPNSIGRENVYKAIERIWKI